MKKLIVVTCAVVLALVGPEVSAQREAPAGASDKNLADRGIKDRSIEIERMKRDAAKPDRQNGATDDTARFGEVKEDFENIQRLQDEIVKAYTTGKQIEFKNIAANAEQINSRATRLASNLFPPTPEEKKKKKTREAKVEPAISLIPKDVKSIIVEQDNTLARFVENPMFKNPTVANVDDQINARAALQKVIQLSAALKVEAEKQPK